MTGVQTCALPIFSVHQEGDVSFVKQYELHDLRFDQNVIREILQSASEEIISKTPAEFFVIFVSYHKKSC